MKKEEQDRHEEDVACCAAICWKARGVVPDCPVDDGTEDGDWDLGDDHGGAEGEPIVDPAGMLAGFP